jgi:hypothetical protein
VIEGVGTRVVIRQRRGGESAQHVGDLTVGMPKVEYPRAPRTEKVRLEQDAQLSHRAGPSQFKVQPSIAGMETGVVDIAGHVHRDRGDDEVVGAADGREIVDEVETSIPAKSQPGFRARNQEETRSCGIDGFVVDAGHALGVVGDRFPVLDGVGDARRLRGGVLRRLRMLRLGWAAQRHHPGEREQQGPSTTGSSCRADEFRTARRVASDGAW